jgi:hypothetical protein
MLRVARQVRNYSNKFIFKSVTYSSLSTGALPQLVEVDEELFYADAIPRDKSLDLALDVVITG